MEKPKHMASKKKHGKIRSRILEAVYEWTGAAVVSLTCVALLLTFVFRIIGVDGFSMENTLHDKERLILWTIGFTPEHGDIVVINRYVETPLIKRVIALPGDTIHIDVNGQVWLNGAILKEPYLDPDKLVNGTETPTFQFVGPVTVPEGCLFVMGDHRADSKDSRSNEIGFIRIKDVTGKAVLRIWPPSRIGSIYKQGVEDNG